MCIQSLLALVLVQFADAQCAPSCCQAGLCQDVPENAAFRTCVGQFDSFCTAKAGNWDVQCINEASMACGLDCSTEISRQACPARLDGAETFPVYPDLLLAAPNIAQPCSGETPVTCIFFPGPIGGQDYCAATADDCEYASICPAVTAPILCHYYGRCVDDISKCEDCPAGMFRCQVDFSCAASKDVCPAKPEPVPALVKAEYSAVVGVLLSEGPAELMDRAAEYYMQLSDEYWHTKAMNIGKHTEYKQVFRTYYTDGGLQALTLPPENLWEFNFEPAVRRTIDGNEYVVREYTYTGYLIGSESSLQTSEPVLLEIGGSWFQNWTLPIDDTMLLQRTGYACMDEAEFPVNSVDSENTWVYFDDTCGPETEETAACHLTKLWDISCVDALEEWGSQYVEITWTRVEWDDEIAAEHTYPKDDCQPEDPDLQILDAGMKDNRIYWRYFTEDACEIEEGEQGCVKEKGWRKILTFSSSSVNNGKSDMVIGVPDSHPWSTYAIYSFSECHAHYHFDRYGTFSYGEEAMEKTGFCLQSTWRYYNNKHTPFGSDFGTCAYQGVSAGWGDDYISGLACQWVDITDAPPGTHHLVEKQNPDGFICEGKMVTDARGEFIFQETDFVNEHGEKEARVKCDFLAGAFSNNMHEEPVVNPPLGGTMVTSACSNHEFGPKRNCGFHFVSVKRACTPGAVVVLNFLSTAAYTSPAVIRICDFSTKQDLPMPCEYSYSLANTVHQTSTKVTFVCPTARDETEQGGLYSIIGASLLETDPFIVPGISG